MEVYRLLFDDYQIKEKDINLYDLIMRLITQIPHLKSCYDIIPHDDNPKSYDEFEFKLQLYRGQLEDGNNTYSPIAESESLPPMYKPFTDSRSISTWHTMKSVPSIDGVPDNVDVSHQSFNDSDSQASDTLNKSKTPSNDTDNNMGDNEIQKPK